MARCSDVLLDWRCASVSGEESFVGDVEDRLSADVGVCEVRLSVGGGFGVERFSCGGDDDFGFGFGVDDVVGVVVGVGGVVGGVVVNVVEAGIPFEEDEL